MKNIVKEEERVTRKFWRDINKIWIFTNAGRRRSLFGLVLITIATLIMTFIPYLLGKILDREGHSPDDYLSLCFDQIWQFFVILAVMVLAWFILVNIGRRIYIKNSTMGKARCMILEKIDNKHIDEVEKHPTGEFVGLLSNDLSKLTEMIHKDLPGIIENTALILLVIIFMFLTNVQLALVYIVIFLVIVYVIRHIGRKMRTDVENGREELMAMNGYLDDIYTNRSLIKLYGLEPRAMNKFRKMNSKFSQTYLSMFKLMVRVDPIGRIVENLGFILSSVIGIMLYGNSLITIGMLVTFVSYASLLGNPLMNIATEINAIQVDMVSLKKVMAFLESDEIDRSGISADGITGRIVADDITYSYGETEALSHVSFTIESGRIIAFTGATGSGKSTFVDILLGIRNADRGNLFYDHTNVKDFQRFSLRSSVSLCPTVPWIFNGTIFDNIRYVRQDATLEDVKRASETVGFDKIAERFDEGYETLLGENGRALSPGESQMLSLARIMLMDPKVVIFDESMSLLDMTQKDEVCSRTFSALKGKTLILVTGDEGVLKYADGAIHFDNGKTSVL